MLRDNVISTDDILALPWLRHHAIFKLFFKFAHSYVALSFAIDKTKIQELDLLNAKTSRILPASCLHLSKTFDKLLKTSSTDSTATLQMNFLIELELEKVKSRLAKQNLDYDAIKGNLALDLRSFLEKLDANIIPPLHADFIPAHQLVLENIFSTLCTNIRADFIHRQNIHLAALEKRKKQQELNRNKQAEILTFTKGDFEKTVRNLIRATARTFRPPTNGPQFIRNSVSRSKNGNGRRQFVRAGAASTIFRRPARPLPATTNQPVRGNSTNPESGVRNIHRSPAVLDASSVSGPRRPPTGPRRPPTPLGRPNQAGGRRKRNFRQL